MRSFLIVPALVLLLAACGGERDVRSAGTTEASTSIGPGATDAGPGRGPSSTEAELEVELAKYGGEVGFPAAGACADSCTLVVSCSPAQHDAVADEVCAWIATDGTVALGDVAPEQEACTEIYGGPETAHVTGTIDRTPVDASFSRTDGCEIRRWDAVVALWTGDPPRSPAPADSASG